jgi:tRNA threonylcarbamoyladenosine biosynthesis protein TsaE
LGYEDYFYSGNYCFIEWPEKIETLLPQNFVEVKIDVVENETRIISAKTI